MLISLTKQFPRQLKRIKECSISIITRTHVYMCFIFLYNIEELN